MLPNASWCSQLNIQQPHIRAHRGCSRGASVPPWVSQTGLIMCMAQTKCPPLLSRGRSNQTVSGSVVFVKSRPSSAGIRHSQESRRSERREGGENRQVLTKSSIAGPKHRAPTPRIDDLKTSSFNERDRERAGVDGGGKEGRELDLIAGAADRKSRISRFGGWPELPFAFVALQV